MTKGRSGSAINHKEVHYGHATDLGHFAFVIHLFDRPVLLLLLARTKPPDSNRKLYD